MERVAELVEQRHGLRVRQQRRRVADGRVEVADEIRHGRLESARELRARDAAVDPRAAALVRPRVEIDVEAADERAVAPTDLVIAHGRMPNARWARGRDREIEQPVHDREQPVEHARQREVRPQLLLGEPQPLLAQTLRIERDVPRLERPARVLGQHRELLLGDRPAAPREIAQELDHALGRVGHLGRERKLREAREAEQPRALVAQREDLLDQRPVVGPPRIRALVRRARDPRLVEPRAQRRRLRVREHGLIGRRVEP